MHTVPLQLLFILLLLPGCFGFGKGSLPEIKKDCFQCHVDRDGKPSPLLEKPVAELCVACHPDRTGEREHKVDIVPRMTVRGLPLFDKKITCVTCHDPHNNRYGKLLRVRSRDLCLRCHVK